MLVFTAVISVVSGVLFGLVPAVRYGRRDLSNPLYADKPEIREAVMALTAAHAAGFGFQDLILWGRPEDVWTMP